MPLQLGQGPHCLALQLPQNWKTETKSCPWLRACQMDRQTSRWPLLQPSYRSGSQDLPGCPLGCLDHVLTSEHPGLAGAWCSWGPTALCQRVATDDQLQDVARLSQERHRQAAVKVPRANVVDLRGAQPRGQLGISSAWAEGVGMVAFPKCGSCPSPDTG